MANKFVTYVRVSTRKQGASGLGLEAQLKSCMDYINSQGGTVLADFKDVESGTHSDRPGLLAAIEFCKTHGTITDPCVLVIAKLDRLARDVEFTFRVINYGISIYVCDLPVLNTLTLGVFAAVAQYEREMCASRTKSALGEIKENIAKNGGHMSRAGRWVKHLGRSKGADLSAANAASGRAVSRKAQEWRQSSALYLWVENQVLKNRPRKDILQEAQEMYNKQPALYGTREGRPLSKGILSMWVKEIRIGI